MILVNKKRRSFEPLLNKLKKVSWKLWLFIVLLIVLAIVIFWNMTKGEPTFEEQMKQYSKIIADPPRMDIDISFKNYQQILFQRRKALNSGGENFDFLIGFEEFEYVPAKISWENKEYKAKIKLKGARKINFRDSTRLSYRIDMKGDNTIMGMKRFSIHDPKMRNYIYEWVYHKLLKKEGFIALQYDFIRVYLNGQDLGIYAIEEFFDKTLVERYGYLDGPIFKMSDDGDTLFAESSGPMQGSKYYSEEFAATTTKADQMLKGFLEKKYKVSEVFDTKKLAHFLAVCDLLGIYHGSVIKSMRLYFNPITFKFEPIGYDGHFQSGAAHSINANKPQQIVGYSNIIIMVNKWQRLLFYDDTVSEREFIEEYVKSLVKLSSKAYVDSFFAEIGVELTDKLAIIYKNQPLLKDNFNNYGPGEFVFSKPYIVTQAGYIGQLLKMKNTEGKEYIYGYILKNQAGKKTVELNLSNNFILPVDIKRVVINDSVEFAPVSKQPFFPSVDYCIRDYKKVILNGTNSLPEAILSSRIEFSFPGMDEVIIKKIEIRDDTVTPNKEDFIRKPIGLDEYKDYLTLDEAGKRIIFKTGKLNINKPVKIANGYTVYINEGTDISLSDSALILSYSPVQIIGSAVNPVRISSDGTGGLAVLNAQGGSVVENAVLSGLSYPRNGIWKMSGAVTFYQSPVVLKNVEIENNNCEDALNIKQTDFLISDCRFKNIHSDAFDSDFSDGTIENSSFLNCGNDGIDVSGSKIECRNVSVQKAMDKAFSSGEGSHLTLKSITIRDCEIGITSKDRSLVEADSVSISDTKVAYTAFQKKSEYGKGRIESSNSICTRVEKEALIEKGSSAKINGKEISGELNNVSDILYGNEYGVKSK